MNHIYHSIWNEALGAWIAVSEIATGQGKRSKNRRKLIAPTLQKVKPFALSLSKGGRLNLITATLLLITTTAHALPTGNELVAGQATVTTPSTGQMQINQASQNAVINWQGFSIDQNQAVNIQQPNPQAALLNRVVGQDASQIQGQLNANGQVYLVNPNGVLFSKTAQVDVGGLIASTHNITNADFMNGNHHFTQNGATGNIDNQGNIKTPKGTTALAAGKTVDLDFQGNGLIEVKVTEAALNAQITNQGAIKADGGHVILTANAAGQLVDTIINSQGVIQARGLIEKNGVVKLSGGNTGTVEIGGIIDTSNVGWGEARTPTSPTTGGDITVTGANINLKNTANLNASGNTGGGNIKLLANMDNGVINVNGNLNASAPKNGDGGFIETSAAHVNVADTAQISTKANNGKTGTWSIDPVDFTIATSGGDITGTALSNNLANNNVNIASTSGKNGSNGDINVNNSVNWSANQLTLNAQRNININTNLNGSGTAKLALEYGQGALNANNTGKYVVSATVNLPAGQNFSTKLGSDGQVKKYTVITSLGTENDLLVVPAINTLQGIANINTQVGMPNLNSNYVLGANIDATATSTWNAGAGFTPIGITVSGTRFIDTFGGVFDGLGHTIKNLTINLPNVDGVGLFGNTFGNGAVGQFFPEIRNVGLINANVRGNTMVGGLVGYNQGGLNVSNSFVNGSVTGKSAIGGLVGFNANSAITNSYADGGVISGNNNVGGLVGNNMGSISNSYATNSVTGTTKVGGLVGDNVLAGMGGALPGTVSNSYWDTIKSGQATSVGGTGLTSVQMKQQANYSGWDFANTWQIKLAVFDPTLQAFNTQTATLVTAVAPVAGDCIAQYSCVRPSINTNPGSTAQSSTPTTSTPSVAGLPSVTEIIQATTATTPITVVIAQPTDITPVTTTTPSAVAEVPSTTEITQATTTAPVTPETYPPVPYAYTPPSYVPQGIFTPDEAYKSALYVINTKPSVTEPLVAVPCASNGSCYGKTDLYEIHDILGNANTAVGIPITKASLILESVKKTASPLSKPILKTAVQATYLGIADKGLFVFGEGVDWHKYEADIKQKSDSEKQIYRYSRLALTPERYVANLGLGLVKLANFGLNIIEVEGNEALGVKFFDNSPNRKAIQFVDDSLNGKYLSESVLLNLSNP